MGDTANNWLPEFHVQPAGSIFEVKTTRHKGDDAINAATSTAGAAGWATIVSAARSSMTDTEFASAVATVWPGWSASHLTGGNATEYRAVVLAIVDP